MALMMMKRRFPLLGAEGMTKKIDQSACSSYGVLRADVVPRLMEQDQGRMIPQDRNAVAKATTRRSVVVVATTATATGGGDDDDDDDAVVPLFLRPLGTIRLPCCVWGGSKRYNLFCQTRTSSVSPAGKLYRPVGAKSYPQWLQNKSVAARMERFPKAGASSPGIAGAFEPVSQSRASWVPRKMAGTRSWRLLRTCPPPPPSFFFIPIISAGSFVGSPFATVGCCYIVAGGWPTEGKSSRLIDVASSCSE
jgi:hypothetical protein